MATHLPWLVQIFSTRWSISAKWLEVRIPQISITWKQFFYETDLQHTFHQWFITCNWNEMEISFTVIHFLTIQSLQKFTLATTAVLLWHVQKFGAVMILIVRYQANNITSEYEIIHEISLLKPIADMFGVWSLGVSLRGSKGFTRNETRCGCRWLVAINMAQDTCTQANESLRRFV